MPDGSVPPATALVGRLTRAELKQTLLTTKARGMRILTPSDAHWPARLTDLGPEQPLALWARGDMQLVPGANVAALTGSRNATAYGTQVTTDLAADLAQGDHVLVSGTGFGIDEATHRAALTVPAPSVTVSSCGLDRTHPAANEVLLEAVLRSGGLVISEHPPGTTPSRTRAVRAGRIIAALAAATVIVEAGVRSASIGIAH